MFAVAVIEVELKESKELHKDRSTMAGFYFTTLLRTPAKDSVARKAAMARLQKFDALQADQTSIQSIAVDVVRQARVTDLFQFVASAFGINQSYFKGATFFPPAAGNKNTTEQ